MVKATPYFLGVLGIAIAFHKAIACHPYRGEPMHTYVKTTHLREIELKWTELNTSDLLLRLPSRLPAYVAELSEGETISLEAFVLILQAACADDAISSSHS
jgi:hypothetical protein